MRCVEFVVTLDANANSFSVSCITDSCSGSNCSGALDIQIDCGGGSSSLGTPLCITDSMTGTFTITICKQGASDPARYVIQSSSTPAPPVADFNASSNQGCSPMPVNFTSSICTDSVLWDFGDGTTSTDPNPDFTHVFVNPSPCFDTTYTVQLVAYDSTGLTDTMIQTILVHPQPDVNVTTLINPPKACSPYPETFSSTSTCADFLYWDFGNGMYDTTVVDTTYNMTYTNTFTDSNLVYDFMLIGENAWGCQDTVMKSVTVYALVIADFTMTPDSIGCGPFNVTFNNTSLGANGYSWDFGDGNTSNQQNPSHTFSAGVNDTTYIVQLIATSPKCSDTITKIVTVAEPVVLVTPTSATICTSDSITLTASGALTYNWSPAAGLSATTGNTVIASPNTTTTYTVVGTDGSGCTDSATVIITIDSVTPAVASFSAFGTTGCEGMMVSFNNTSTNATGYSWNFPGGTPNLSTAQNPTVTYNTAGNYDVTLTAFGCSGDSTVTQAAYISVAAYPTANITAGGPTTFCDGDSVELVSDVANSYAWLMNGSTTGNTGINYYAAVSGSYQVIATNSSGCSDTSATITVTVNSLPTVTVTPTAPTICSAGDSVTITASGASTYTWSPGTGLSSTVGSSVIAFPTSTSTYVVVGTDANGCVDSASATVTIDSITPAVANFSAFGTTVCEGMDVTFNNTSTNATGFSWTFSGGTPNSSTVQNPVINYPAAGTYDVSLTAFGCSADNTLTLSSYITVNPNPTANVTASGALSFCAGDSVELVSDVATTYDWLLNGTSTGNSGLNYYANASGDYQVAVTNTFGCVDTSAVTTVTVNSAPAANITASGNTSFCAGDSVELVADVANSYVWLFNGTPTGETGINYYANTAGNYQVVVTNTTGCSDTSAPATVTIYPAVSGTTYSTDESSAGANDGTAWVEPINGTAPYTFLWTPGGETTDTINGLASGSYTVTVTDANDCMFIDSIIVGAGVGIYGFIDVKDEIRIYPNPVTHLATVEFADRDNAEYTLTLHNSTGQLVLQIDNITSGPLHIGNKDLNPGLYLLQIRNNSNGLIGRGKLILK